MTDVFATLPATDTELNTERTSKRWFSTNSTVSGSPRLVKIRKTRYTTKDGNPGWLLNATIVIDSFETESRLHTLKRYSNVVKLQHKPQVTTTFFVGDDRIDETNTEALFALLGLRGWTRKGTNTIAPSGDFDPENPTAFGVVLDDFEINTNDDDSMEQFEGDFTSAADMVADMADQAIEEEDVELAKDVKRIVNFTTGVKDNGWGRDAHCGRFVIEGETFSLWPNGTVESFLDTPKSTEEAKSLLASLRPDEG